MATLLLTGATGFLGSHLLKGLLRETDYDVVVLKRSTSNAFRIREELISDRIKSYDIDLIPLRQVFSQFSIDIIVHSATNYGRDNDDILEIVEANLVLPLKLLQLGAEYGLTTFINTDTVIDKNISHYSLSKNQFADWLMAYADRIKCVNLRLEHFYGAFDNNTKFTTFIVRSLLNNVKCVDLTAGEQKRHFIYIDDVTSAFMCVLKNLGSISGCFNSFDISTEKSHTIKEFTNTAKKLAGNTLTQLNFGALPYRDGEKMDIHTNIEPLKSLGWAPGFSLTEGLALMMQKEKESLI